MKNGRLVAYKLKLLLTKGIKLSKKRLKMNFTSLLNVLNKEWANEMTVTLSNCLKKLKNHVTKMFEIIERILSVNVQACNLNKTSTTFVSAVLNFGFLS